MTPAPDHVSGDLPCTECGYNLRTLAADKVCPECATPVEKSVNAPKNFGMTLLIGALIVGISPWVLGAFAAALIPSLRVSSAIVVLLFGLSALAAGMMLLARPGIRRRCGRYTLGRAGRSATVLCILILLAGIGMGGYLAYELRDTTAYAPGFRIEAFDQVEPGMSRSQVESLIGQPFGTRPPLDAVGVVEVNDLLGPPPGLQISAGDLAAWYSRRRGFRGWRYLVVYDEHGVVKATRCYEYAD